MKNLVVGIGDCQVSSDPAVSLITYALGSCIAIAIYDPVSCVGGLLHYLLPDATIDADKAARNPFMFADTGIPALFHGVYSLGAVKSRLRITAAGGAQAFDSEAFQIGKRNQLAMKKILWRAGVLIHHEELGGSSSRTIRMEMNSGRVLMRTAGGIEQPVGTEKAHRGREMTHHV
jgi:chemotaxis protein CheD